MVVGWREWVALPELNIPRIKAKIDTGARTSALHAFQIDCYVENNQTKVAFAIHPKQGDINKVINCIADVIDIRWVMDSGGHRERRYVIATQVQLAHFSWPIEMTLTNRDDMRFRMLLGRTALQNRLLVNPASSYLLGRKQIKS